MDLVKVFEQTVRDLKREVNLKVLKIPEIEQKVLDATDEEPWGPHGTVLAEIAQATKKFSECQIVMNVLWTRLTETGKNWRLAYKALTVIEYLVAHGSERAVDEIIEHTFQISSLASFEYVEPNGKDSGLNVRKKAETVTSLLNDKDKIQGVRNNAATNRDKYFGLSSSGITYKSGAASFSSSNSRGSGQYGGFGDKGTVENFRDSYKDPDEYGEDKYESKVKSKVEAPRFESMKKTSPATGMPETLTSTKKLGIQTPPPPANALGSKYDEDVDDFDPRGSSTLKSHGNSRSDSSFPVIDLFGEPLAAPTGKSTTLEDNPSDIDLFANANFVSATPEPEVEKHAALQSNVDLFASHPTPAISSTFDFFATPDPVSQPDTNASKSDKASSMVDPFASLPMNTFDAHDPDAFGSFTSHTYSPATQPNRDSQNDEASSETKKVTFQVKSGIWADSLSRGLIDLNITAPKKMNLTDVSVSSEKDKAPLWGGMGQSGFTSTPGSTTANFFSTLSDQQNQFGSFQK